jgi:Na+/H+ antiporter NhaB
MVGIAVATTVASIAAVAVATGTRLGSVSVANAQELFGFFRTSGTAVMTVLLILEC